VVGQLLNRGRRASPRLPRAFRVFWLGEAVSLFGTATTATLLSLLAATQLDAGPGWMGILAAASWSPWLILGLPAGVLADRWPPHTTMIVSDLIAATAPATVPLLWVTGTLSLAALVVVAFVIGSCAVVFRAALPRLVTRVVGAEQLGTANSMLYATESASTIVGPELAGLIAQAMSAALGVLLDAISFLVSAVCLARTRPATRPPNHAAAVPEESFLQRIDPHLRCGLG
jgi:hypothetical protein